MRQRICRLHKYSRKKIRKCNGCCRSSHRRMQRESVSSGIAARLQRRCMKLSGIGSTTHRPLSTARIKSVWKKRTEVMRTSRTSFTVRWICRILPFCRRSYVVPTAACRRKQQQQQQQRRRSQSGADVSSDDVSVRCLILRFYWIHAVRRLCIICLCK